MKDAKYLIAYIGPLTAWAGLHFGGIWSPGMFYLAFVIIPFLEIFMPARVDNYSGAEEARRSTNTFFDVLLYLHVPILYGLLFYYLHLISTEPLSIFEQIGMTLNIGTMIGAFGINVAHELGHRPNAFERVLAKLLLLPALYMHFIIEHNLGHHRNVGTPEDAATSRRGEPVFAFWWRSTTQGYLHAWQLEARRLQQSEKPFWSGHNEMLRFSLFQLLYLVGVGLFFGPVAVPFALAAAMIGFLLLETVNYIEHYGLMRRKLPSGRYEKVELHHSWNSDHELGRIFLYELTRHADHHYKTTRKYQILRHHDASPQLPMGYPAAMLLSLAPPLWFRVVHPLLEQVPGQE